MTPFATIWDRASRKKYSIDGPDLLPEMALLDPQLTLGLSKEMTVSTGLDAISHALESAWDPPGRADKHGPWPWAPCAFP